MANILLVEDHGDSREVIRIALETGGHTVADASTGEDGINMLERFSPNLIILDISLAGDIDGIETLRRLRAMRTLDSVPVFALTAHAMAQDRAAITEAGFDKYLTKPIVDFDEFNAAVNEGIVNGRQFVESKS